jgi:prolyl-tRNA synthetase
MSGYIVTMSKHALTVTRTEHFPEWYQAVVRDADMAEASPVRGCMIIKPWGYGIWELLQRQLDDRIKAFGFNNCYFPVFIPMSFIAKEAEHVEGFAKEMAVVTHHRLRNVGGKLEVDPEAKLEEPLIVRPTSETIIGESFHRWIQSYRDLPLRINQWVNIVRWEMRTRLFLEAVRD